MTKATEKIFKWGFLTDSEDSTLSSWQEQAGMALVKRVRALPSDPQAAGREENVG